MTEHSAGSFQGGFVPRPGYYGKGQGGLQKEVGAVFERRPGSEGTGVKPRPDAGHGGVEAEDVNGTRPRLLDLFCGAGGAAMGYHRAGFAVVGVDIAPQPRYPFEFICGDALMLNGWDAPSIRSDFDAIHASPPCQWASALRHLWPDREHTNLIPATRDLLLATGLPFVIENVPQARPALRSPMQLCGSALGLDLRRHRLFECHGFDVMGPPCAHGWQAPRFVVADRRAKSLSTVVSPAGHATNPTRRSPVVSVHGSSGNSRVSPVVSVHGTYTTEQQGGVALWRRAMGIDWMTRDELAQAIPPAYTEHIGHYLMGELNAWGC